jgi:hypothetical protein
MYDKYFEEIESLIQKTKQEGNDPEKVSLIINSLQKEKVEKEQFIKRCDGYIARLREGLTIRQEADIAAYDTEHGTGKVRIEDIPF